MRHIRLVVEYDGTALCGWQRQANGPTVQGHLEAALGKLLAHEARVVGASRTDAGVHARGQVASFRTERAIPLHGIRRGLNSLLPPAIAVADAAEVPDDFHPRFSATGKHYRYLVFTRGERSPRWRDRAWHHPGALDVAAMRQAAAALIGEHDFAAFRAAGCTAKSTVRRIDEIVIGAGGVDEIVIGAGGVDEVTIGVGGVEDPRDATRGGVNGPAVPVQRGRESPLGMKDPRDATRGGVNGPAVPVQRGRESPLGIMDPRDATRGGVNGPALPVQRGRESPLSGGVEDPRDATRGGVNGPALPVQRGRESPLSIDVRGNAFLRNMVRIVVGTLVEVGAGRRPAEQVAEILASRDRTRAGITAPPQGLELMSVRYDGRKMGPPHGVE